MSKTLTPRTIIHSLAEHVTRQVIQRAIDEFEDMTECLGSGECSGLENVWEEICVQVQYEQSVMWSAYVETMEGILSGLVEELPGHEREALWLETEPGEDWDCEDEDERDAYQVRNDEIVRHLLEEHLLVEAGRWTNERISAYLERATAID